MGIPRKAYLHILNTSTSKYHNKLVGLDGYKFASKKERLRYVILKDMASKGEITCLKIHPRYLLQGAFDKNGKHYRPIYYIADFEYLAKTGQVIVEDVKGFRKEKVFLLKQKLFEKKFSALHISII